MRFFDDNYTQNILEGVIHNHQLRILNLEWNMMRGSKVYQAASRMLKINTTLRSLDLKHCGMDLESAYVLAKGLSLNGTLQTLVLDGNPIGQNGARQIMVRRRLVMTTILLASTNDNQSHNNNYGRH